MVRPTFPSASSAASNGLVRNKASKVIDFKTIEWARDALYTTYTFGDKFEYMADIEERCVLLYMEWTQFKGYKQGKHRVQSTLVLSFKAIRLVLTCI